MNFPLSISEISIWIAITAIILLVTSELLHSYSGQMKFLLSKTRLRWAALILGLAFMVTVLIRAINPSII